MIRHQHTARPTVVRYSFYGPVLPLIQETLPIGELARRCLQGIYGRQNQGDSSLAFSGKSHSGRPLLDHKHAMFLAADEDGDGKLDHLTVFARGGFTEADLRACRALRELRQPGGKPDLGVVMTGWGAEENFRGIELFGPARLWRSATPFVPVRYPKRRGGRWVDTQEDQVKLELQRRNLPDFILARPLPNCELRDGGWLDWMEFRRDRRTGGGRQARVPACGFEIAFTAEVCGPIALGYGCHFGRGQFRAVK